MARPEADAARQTLQRGSNGAGGGARGFRAGPASARGYQDTVVCLCLRLTSSGV